VEIACPLTGAAFVRSSRADKEAERKARERRRIFEHAKRQGVEDVESWLASLDDNKDVSNEHRTNSWSMSDKHNCIAVGANGLTLTPNYTSMRECNGLVRAQQGYYSGRHYFEITLERFSVAGQGWHCIGVAGPDDVLEGQPGQIMMGTSDTAACLCLENCQKLKATGRPMEYGKRAVKQGDVVGVLLDLDLGELSFFLNGADMGVAFYGMRGPLFPSVEMGMMVGQHHQYRATFNATPPSRRKLEGPPMSDDEAFRHISQNLPKTSHKHAGEGFGSILSVPVASQFFVNSLGATVETMRGR
jgi:SPRY domain.